MVLFEPIIVARKPLKGSCVDNVLEYGTGGLNIDECRVPAKPGEYDIRHYTNEDCFQNLKPKESKFQVKPQPEGRFPANTIFTYSNEDYEEVCGGFPYTRSQYRNVKPTETLNKKDTVFETSGYKQRLEGGFNDSGSASRYFYNAKESEKDIENFIVEDYKCKDLGGLMKLYSENEEYKLYQGNMLDMLEVIEPNSIDSIVTDPPYELNFMAKGWDNAGVSFQPDTWKKCLGVLKPGGYLLAFGGSRTFHRIACAIEDAGFEIRDTIMWLYGSGFPKSMNLGLAIDKKNGVESKIVGYSDTTMPDFRDVGKKQKELIGIDKLTFGQIENSERKETPIYEPQNEWKGWGTCLKPSYEPIIVARKPFKGSCVDNVLEYGVGGINIDECRVANTEADTYDLEQRQVSKATGSDNDGHFLDELHNQDSKHGVTEQGRFPANTILTYDETDFNEVCDGFPTTKSTPRTPTVGGTGGVGQATNFQRGSETSPYNDSGSASRYFYTSKASKKDRDEGLENFEATTDNAKGNGLDRVCEFCGVSQLTPELCHCETKSWITKPKKNTHPTVKPCDLMEYLVRLVTPNGGTILDPFNGSGSTGKAVMYENKERNKNYKYIGIELTEEYLPISKARIEYVCNLKDKE